MPDFTLHGNHDPCPACELQREALFEACGGPVPIEFGQIPCNNCGGTGMIKLTSAEIVARQVAEARVHHWPAFERRIAER